MADGQIPDQTRAGTVQPGRRRRYVMLAIVALALISAWWSWPTISAQAQAGTSFGARVACSCRYVGNRPLADCEKDFMAGMELVSVEDDDAARRVVASVPLIATNGATYREGWGCVLDPVSD